MVYVFDLDSNCPKDCLVWRFRKLDRVIISGHGKSTREDYNHGNTGNTFRQKCYDDVMKLFIFVPVYPAQSSDT